MSSKYIQVCVHVRMELWRSAHPCWAQTAYFALESVCVTTINHCRGHQTAKRLVISHKLKFRGEALTLTLSQAAIFLMTAQHPAQISTTTSLSSQPPHKATQQVCRQAYRSPPRRSRCPHRRPHNSEGWSQPGGYGKRKWTAEGFYRWGLEI